MKLKQFTINSIVILLPILFLILFAFKPYLRDPSPADLFFLDVAVDFSAPDICGKIHRWAHWEAGFATVPIGYLRSECYEMVALKLKDPNICRFVKSVSTIFLNGRNMNSESCIEKIARGEGTTQSSHMGYYAINKMMARAGITEDKIRTDPRYSRLMNTLPVEDLYMQVFIDLEYSHGPERTAFLDAVRKL